MSVLCARVDLGLRRGGYTLSARPRKFAKHDRERQMGKPLRKMHRRDRERRDLSRLFYNAFGLSVLDANSIPWNKKPTIAVPCESVAAGKKKHCSEDR